MTILRSSVTDNAIIRAGHQPYHRTIGDLLDDMARTDVHSAFVRDELEQIRLGRGPRNGTT